MPTCTVRWRSSGGRGEFEFVPADTLLDRVINVVFEPLNLTIAAEVRGMKAQGKPRLRKFEKNNRKKFHLPQLIMAVARLPEPGREDLVENVVFPLENKSFVMDGMDFDIIDDDGVSVTLSPLRVSILHTDVEIDLQDRLKAISVDLQSLPEIAAKHPALSQAIAKHGALVMAGVNTTEIRKAADRVVDLQAGIFGMTNAGSAVVLEQVAALPPTDVEMDYVGKEGSLLTRLHVYRERDRGLMLRAKKHYKSKSGGTLLCEVCDLNPVKFYGETGERCIEAHHKVPIAQLQPDSVTRIQDMAMVCASCHRVIHSRNPCLTIPEIRYLVQS